MFVIWCNQDFTQPGNLSFALWHAISLASEQDNQSIFWGKTNHDDLNKDESQEQSQISRYFALRGKP